jgi:diaminohydroxyphosphoribosylaminopyrimidine deaminase / 5-amino-6-(5-phosphoribosylamino)uracil reductase
MIGPSAPDDKFMKLALAEARKGLGHTSPNPAVGAVIVKAGRVVATGYHRAAGGPHAEIEAIRALKNPTQARGATIYVTLEPCSTHGRTPPCSASIIKSGLTRVVYGATDPNPAHAGRATHILEAAGISVTSGVLATECTTLNTEWNHWISSGFPWVIAKCGMSLDGRIGSHPESRWITNEASRVDAMKLRSRVDAILVGGETIRTDNPHLTLRPKESGRQPWRVIWTKTGRLPKSANVFSDGHKDRTLVFEGASLNETLAALGRMEITSVLIEGGGRTLGEAFDQRLVNRVAFYLAPQFLGGPIPAIGDSGISLPQQAARLREVTFSRIDSDIKIEGVVHH